MLSLDFSLSIGSGYLLTPKSKNRAGAYCKPPPPVRFTIGSHGGRVLNPPPPGWGGGDAHIISFCICAVYLRIAYAVHIIQLRRALAGHPFQALAAARSHTRSARAGSAVRL